ncbi:MAG: reverse transcriptase domain-containing protein [Anaerocolumna sp.]
MYLDQFDKKLEQRGIKFVGYADDIQIYVGSLRSGHRVMENTIKLLENKHMGLKVNKEKSAVKKPNESKFLGYSF